MSRMQPPRWASRFLNWFVAEELREEIIGDLEEAYQYRKEQVGKFKADLWFISDVFKFFKPYTFEKYSRTKQYLPMVKNYFKIALRNIVKRKGFTAINLGGLTVSLSVILIVGLFLNYHKSYDQHYPKSERTYRLENVFRSQTYAPFRFDGFYGADRNAQLETKAFLNSFSEVEEVAYLLQSDAAISQQDEYFLEFGDERHAVELILFTNTPNEFLSIFPQHFTVGSEGLFSADFQKVLLTESLAARLFGDNWNSEQLIGKAFKMEAENQEASNYTIAGIIDDPKPNSHFTFNMIVNTPRIPSWGAYTYFTTPEPIDPQLLKERINERYVELEPVYGKDERYKGVQIQNVSDIHLANGDILYELRARVNPTILTIFATVALVILFITWTNYMNLSIAMYSHRQKEIGMRKVMGARSKDIVYQLMVEIIMVSLLAFPLAMFLVYMVLPLFNHLMELQIPTSKLFSFGVIASAIGITIFTGVISGLYPALIFSRKHLLNLFKSKLNQAQGKYGFGMRRMLVGAQFVLLVLMLSLTGYIYLQMDFVRSKDLGFNQEGVINVPIEGIEKHRLFKEKLQSLSEIAVVGTGRIPGRNRFNMTTYLLQGKEEIFDDANVIYADYETMIALGIDHPAFKKLENGLDRVHLINHALAQNFTSTYDLTQEDLIGKVIVDEPEYTDPETGEVGVKRPIDGILPDMHYFSLKFDINPLIFAVDREPGWAFNSVVRLKEGENLLQVIPQIEEAYYEAGNTTPFDFSFLSKNIEQLYESERRTFWLISVLSVVAILLAMVGLIGLVSYLVFTRQKEIGIRKVFGASITQILFIVNKEFIILMVLATAIATPFIYLIAGKWLENFAYRIDMSPMMILAAGAGAMLIVALVVSFQSRKTATTNPTDVLTEE